MTTIPVATEAQRRAVLRTVQDEATRTEQDGAVLRQPVEQIRSPEAAVAAALLEPDTESRETAYCVGYIDGYFAGRQYDRLATLSARQADERHAAYLSPYSPLPFAAALDSMRNGQPRYDGAAMRKVGWLTGFADAVTDSPDARACEACSRALFEDLDDTWRCERHGVVVCRGPGSHCEQAICEGPGHRECHPGGWTL